MREGISACVLTFNNEDKIRRCLDSLTWCDEIVVVDSLSTDRTVEICRDYTDQVYEQKFLGYVGQHELARTKAKHPWVLMLDSDEEVSPGLREEIEEILNSGGGGHVGFRFPRQVNYLGAWIRYGDWYPDMKLRFFRKDLGRVVGEDPHDYVVVDGPVKTLKNPLYHYTYDDLEDQVVTLNRFSGISARTKHKAGKRFHWWDFVFRPVVRFFKGYILKRGILEGRRGVLIAVISSFEVVLKYAKLWELELGEKGKAESGHQPGRQTMS